MGGRERFSLNFKALFVDQQVSSAGLAGDDGVGAWILTVALVGCLVPAVAVRRSATGIPGSGARAAVVTTAACPVTAMGAARPSHCTQDSVRVPADHAPFGPNRGGGSPATAAARRSAPRRRRGSRRRSQRTAGTPDLGSLKLKIEPRSVADLKPRLRNPRTHTEEQIRKIASSIERFGFTNPVLVDAKGEVIAGHGRLAAAKLLGISEVPTIRLDHLTEAEMRAYVIADNRLAELAGWDDQILAIELQYLAELDFDVTLTGFEIAEVDLRIEALTAGESDEDDEVAPIDTSKPAVTRPGDAWTLGRHRIVCADATDPKSFGQLLGRKHAQMVFTDPPYNVRINGHVSGMGKTKHREFAMASGEMTPHEYRQFLQDTLGHLAGYTRDGSIHFICIDWRHVRDVIDVGAGIYRELKNLCAWVKDNAGMGSLYRSQHELILVFKHGDAPHVNNVELGRYGRYRTNVWRYPGASALRNGGVEELAMHPTVKPVVLVKDAILDCSKRNDIVLDCFGGSGTTLIAAEKAGRRGYLLEIDPLYVDVTIERFEKLTGDHAINEATGLRYRDTKAEASPAGAGT